jgi:hypothetical protein
MSQLFSNILSIFSPSPAAKGNGKEDSEDTSVKNSTPNGRKSPSRKSKSRKSPSSLRAKRKGSPGSSGSYSNGIGRDFEGEISGDSPSARAGFSGAQENAVRAMHTARRGPSPNRETTTERKHSPGQLTQARKTRHSPGQLTASKYLIQEAEQSAPTTPLAVPDNLVDFQAPVSAPSQQYCDPPRQPPLDSAYSSKALQEQPREPASAQKRTTAEQDLPIYSDDDEADWVLSELEKRRNPKPSPRTENGSGEYPGPVRVLPWRPPMNGSGFAGYQQGPNPKRRRHSTGAANNYYPAPSPYGYSPTPYGLDRGQPDFHYGQEYGGYGAPQTVQPPRTYEVAMYQDPGAPYFHMPQQQQYGALKRHREEYEYENVHSVYYAPPLPPQYVQAPPEPSQLAVDDAFADGYARGIAEAAGYDQAPPTAPPIRAPIAVTPQPTPAHRWVPNRRRSLDAAPRTQLTSRLSRSRLLLTPTSKSRRASVGSTPRQHMSSDEVARQILEQLQDFQSPMDKVCVLCAARCLVLIF